MFRAKIKEGILLKKIIDCIKELASEINLEVSLKGISLKLMDYSHVALANLFLSKEGFEEYQCDENMILGISLQNFSKVLRLVGNEDSLILSCEDESNKLKIKFQKSSKYIFIKNKIKFYRF